MTDYFYISVILSFSLLIAAFIYGISNKDILNNELSKWYIFYLGFIAVIEISTLISVYILEAQTTQYLYPFYVTGEFLILMSLFLTELKVAKKWKIIMGLVASYIFIESTVLWFVNQDASTGYAKIVSHLSIICLAAILLIKNIKELEKDNPRWIINGFLFLYYGVSLFLFLLMSQLTEQNINIWIINNILSSILYLSFIYTFLKLKKWR